MAKALNFNNIKKNFWTVTLNDEKKTTLFIGMPTKGVMDNLLLIKEHLDAVTDDEVDIETMNILYEAVAKVMSRNKANVEITGEYLGKIWDFEDIMIFFYSYMEFVEEITNSKN